ncbi:MAG: CBS domain-containing protein, partial [Chloroflexi bacterium]|nr:CBS domain-containing protein [Chloroflexota bacterium]
LYTVLRLLTEEDVAQLPVVRDHNIIGMIGRDHILAFVNVRGELGR